MTAQFGIESLKTRTNLTLSIDNETLELACEDERINRFLKGLRKARIVGIDDGDYASLITVRSSSLNRYTDVPDITVQVLDTLYNAADADNRIPTVRMSHGTIGVSGSRRGMHLALRWPDVDINDANRFATLQMQNFAESVNLTGNSRLNTADDFVYVRGVRKSGMIIETNPLGSCNISSGGDDYNASADVVKLWQHNIYSPEQQLACLMGAVSFATADLQL